MFLFLYGHRDRLLLCEEVEVGECRGEQEASGQGYEGPRKLVQCGVKDEPVVAISYAKDSTSMVQAETIRKFMGHLQGWKS